MTIRVRAQGVHRTFQCAGPDCPSTCCRGWNIRVGPEAVARWDAHGLPDHERPPLTGEGETMSMVLDETGACTLLTPDGACGMHQRWGEQALARVCSLYPRSPLVRPDGVWVTYDLSCPIVAEQVAASDAAVAWVDARVEDLPRAWGRVIELPAGHPGWTLNDALVDAVIASLRGSGPLRDRLIQVAVLGLLATDGVAPDPALAAALAAPHVALSRSLPAALLWVDRLLDWYHHGRPGPLSELQGRSPQLASTRDHAPTLAARRDRARALGDRGPEACWTRLTIHHAQHDLPLDHPDPVTWVTELLMIAAATRVTTLLHPDCEALLDAPDPAGWARLTADAAFRVGRDIAHTTLLPNVPRPPWETAPEARTLAVLALLAEP